MYKVLAEQYQIKVDGQWMTLKAVLTTSVGGRRVEYLNEIGYVVYQQPFKRSPFKDIILDKDGE